MFVLIDVSWLLILFRSFIFNIAIIFIISSFVKNQSSWSLTLWCIVNYLNIWGNRRWPSTCSWRSLKCLTLRLSLSSLLLFFRFFSFLRLSWSCLFLLRFFLNLRFRLLFRFRRSLFLSLLLFFRIYFRICFRFWLLLLLWLRLSLRFSLFLSWLLSFSSSFFSKFFIDFFS